MYSVFYVESLVPHVIEAHLQYVQFRWQMNLHFDYFETLCTECKLFDNVVFLLLNPKKLNTFGYILAEEQTDPYKIPTKHNIRMAMYWLVQGCQPGDSLVFHYSGHGAQQRNYNGDEVDGFDETLCPLDFETQGMIVDDEINTALVRPLPHGVKLHALIDACHSGTALDLPYLCRMDR